MTPARPAIDFAALMPDVARVLLGDPNARLSNPHEWRYRTHGSLAVHVGGPHAGTFRDHEADAGGGVLDLVKREAGARDNREAMAWLRDAGLLDGAGGYLADNELAGRDSPSKGRYRRDCAPAPSSKPPPESRSEAFPGPDDADARRKVARRVWESTEPLPGTIAETYLRHVRGVGHVALAPALRFSPALSHPYAPGASPAWLPAYRTLTAASWAFNAFTWTARAPRARPTSSRYALLSGA